MPRGRCFLLSSRATSAISVVLLLVCCCRALLAAEAPAPVLLRVNDQLTAELIRLDVETKR